LTFFKDEWDIDDPTFTIIEKIKAAFN